MRLPSVFGAKRHPSTVAIGFVTGMLSSLAPRNFDCSELLVRAGIEKRVLKESGGRVTIASYVALYNLVVGTLNDEAFGLFSTAVPIGSLEFLGRSVLTSRSLREMLERGARFLGLVVPDLKVTVDLGENFAVLRISENDSLQLGKNDPRRVFAFEWILRLTHGLACWMVRREIALDSVVFPYPKPTHAADYKLIYTPLAIFDGPELLASFNASLLELPIRRDDRDLDAFLKGGPGKIATLYRRDREMVRLVREIVSAALPAAISLEGVAKRLNISARTLHRRLHEENSSLRAIKDALRFDLALSRLAKTNQPIARISPDLGYVDTSTFFRAFTFWTGMSPSAYRRRLSTADCGSTSQKHLS